MSTTTADGPRSFITTPNDHGGIALTVSTLLMTWAVVCYIIRIYIRADISGPFGYDDLFCTLATAVGIAQSCVSYAAISSGFGKSLSLLTATQIVHVEKAQYAGELLYIITNCLAKMSVAFLLARLTRTERHVRSCYAIVAASGVWGFASLLAEAIRCNTSRPWDTIDGQCSGLFTRWQAITAFDIIIELLLFSMTIWLVWNLQMPRHPKMIVIVAFSLRLPVIVAAIARLHYIGIAINSTNPFLAGVNSFVCQQIEMHYGLMAATIPCLKPFIIRFNTGWGTHDTAGQSPYAMTGQSATKMSRNRSALRSEADRGEVHELSQRMRPDIATHATQIKSDIKSSVRVMSHSESSHDSAEDMIIRRTVSYEVQYEEREKPSSSKTSAEVHSTV